MVYGPWPVVGYGLYVLMACRLVATAYGPLACWLWHMGYGIWAMAYGQWAVGYVPKDCACGLWRMGCGLWQGVYSLWAMDCWLACGL